MSIDNENIHGHLEELSGSDFEIADGQPDVTGWEVKDTDGNQIGEVEELLFDPRSKKVRYLVVDLEDNELNLESDQSVLIPIGLADLHESDDEVIISTVSALRLSAVPAYNPGELTPEYEVLIRSIFNDHGAANSENLPVVYDQDQFYTHGHFNDKGFYERKGRQGQPALRGDEPDNPVL
jgi:sporulation protein YlmC with PRC-barrel domain